MSDNCTVEALGYCNCNEISHILHSCRTRTLKKISNQFNTILSAGANGGWYIDWIKKNLDVKKHICVEYYMDVPNNLPDDIIWIKNTVGNMKDVKTNCCDLVFSGQNLEHIWSDELFGFFKESHRILEEGGRIIIDSPNRLITERYNWSHPEHTIELSPSEIVELLKISGFDVIEKKGLYLCEKEDLTLYPLVPENIEMNIERSKAGYEVDKCFIWWIEAINTSKSIDEDYLKKRIISIFDYNWNLRIKRNYSPLDPSIIYRPGNIIHAPKNPTAAIMAGSHLPLRKGKYEAFFEIYCSFDNAGYVVVKAEPLYGGSTKNLANKPFGKLNGEFIVEFTVDDDMLFNVEFIIGSYGKNEFKCKMGIKKINVNGNTITKREEEILNLKC